MANNCVVTKLMDVVDNDNLEYLGHIHVYVDTTGLSSNLNLYFVNENTGDAYSNPVGSFLTGGKTFVNGKTKIESGDSMAFAPNDTYDLYVPKYNSPLITAYTSDTLGAPVVYDIDDYSYAEIENSQPANSWVTVLNYSKKTGVTRSCSGNLDYILDWANPDVINKIILYSTDVEIDTSSSNFVKLYKLNRLDLRYCSKVVGNLRTFLTAFSAANATQLKARTNNLAILFAGSSGIEKDVFSVPGLASLVWGFSGSSSTTITTANSGGTTLKTYSYDIDTDTLTETT